MKKPLITITKNPCTPHRRATRIDQGIRRNQSRRWQGADSNRRPRAYESPARNNPLIRLIQSRIGSAGGPVGPGTGRLSPDQTPLYGPVPRVGRHQRRRLAPAPLAVLLARLRVAAQALLDHREQRRSPAVRADHRVQPLDQLGRHPDVQADQRHRRVPARSGMTVPPAQVARRVDRPQVLERVVAVLAPGHRVVDVHLVRVERLPADPAPALSPVPDLRSELHRRRGGCHRCPHRFSREKMIPHLAEEDKRDRTRDSRKNDSPLFYPDIVIESSSFPRAYESPRTITQKGRPPNLALSPLSDPLFWSVPCLESPGSV